ncbi:MAG: hypothetical protein Q3988_00055 [Gemella sp.]|nr:hypothetical protein [Gemella sp.]
MQELERIDQGVVSKEDASLEKSSIEELTNYKNQLEKSLGEQDKILEKPQKTDLTSYKNQLSEKIKEGKLEVIKDGEGKEVEVRGYRDAKKRFLGLSNAVTVDVFNNNLGTLQDNLITLQRGQNNIFDAIESVYTLIDKIDAENINYLVGQLELLKETTSKLKKNEIIQKETIIIMCHIVERLNEYKNRLENLQYLEEIDDVAETLYVLEGKVINVHSNILDLEDEINDNYNEIDRVDQETKQAFFELTKKVDVVEENLNFKLSEYTEKNNSKLEKKINEKGKNFETKLSQQKEDFDNKFKQQEEGFVEKITEQEVIFNKKIKEQEENFSAKLQELEKKQSTTNQELTQKIKNAYLLGGAVGLLAIIEFIIIFTKVL